MTSPETYWGEVTLAARDAGWAWEMYSGPVGDLYASTLLREGWAENRELARTRLAEALEIAHTFGRDYIQTAWVTENGEVRWDEG